MEATHFQTKTLKNESIELHFLAYNMKRAICIPGVGGLMEAILPGLVWRTWLTHTRCGFYTTWIKN